MKHTSKNLWKLPVLVCLLGMAACEERADVVPVDADTKPVEVSLCFGFADEEDGYNLSASADTRGSDSGQDGAFTARPVPAVRTRATEPSHPDALYQFYLMQYTAEGTLMGSVQSKEQITAGTDFSTLVTLTPATNCQLVVIVCGKGNTTPSIGGSLANVQQQVMDADLFKKTIPAEGFTQDDINKMPYMLHLPCVNVTSDGKLQSPDGSYDARLLLRRLATRLTVNWEIDAALKNAGYALKEVKLCQVPAAFRLLASPVETQWGMTYPSEVVEFIDYYRLTNASELAAGKKTVWIPANVRGTSAKATSPYYRTKENAPTAASYVELVVDNAVKKGYTFAWGSDVSEQGFTRDGIAVMPDAARGAELTGSDMARWTGLTAADKRKELTSKPLPEVNVTQEMRQAAFDNWETTDDHGMVIYGIAKDQNGKEYFMVKNSWGLSGKYKGIWYASKAFVAYKTMNILVHKDALPKDIAKKLGFK